MAEYLVNDTDMTAVADAIRTKGGTTGALMFPDGFVNAVEAIGAGSGESGDGGVEGSNGLVVGSVNLHDPSSITEGYYVTSAGNEVAYASWSISNYIPVKGGKWYCISTDINRSEYCFYDVDKNVLGEVGINGIVGGIANGGFSLAFFKAKENSAFLRVSKATSVIQSLRVYECEGDIFIPDGWGA